ncbi:MAG: UDP-2,3-diacetamido-2,3-dideoxy-D-glucuronate 2-epimerase [Myxococcota bacterium]|nr:UDP-2,3-diacetamido-2,3-dideoxy-D-glucuronate 2-epimerase [Myxococcota bacterium]
MKELLLVAGARPNFIKVAPVCHALAGHPRLGFTLVHTGQHYDDAMSRRFFEVLDIPAPGVNLEVGSGSHAVQTARIMERFEPVVAERKPAAVVVFGDVNSTAACALVACKLNTPVVHVEAGLRSFDRTMPEEINRIVTDVLSSLLLVSEPSGLRNLLNEGISRDKIVEVGNVMIDSLQRVRPRVEAQQPWTTFGLSRGGYGLVTLHRPANVDDDTVLKALLGALGRVSEKLPLIFPMHPRTRARIQQLGWNPPAGFQMVEPVSYIDSIGLQLGARVVLTDSGGLQEESSCLGTPCLTLRPNTERPVTVELGSNIILGNDPAAVESAVHEVIAGRIKRAQPIPLWDGRAAERVVAAMDAFLHP